jgi:DNA-binding CsgD family transcriptional regulator
MGGRNSFRISAGSEVDRVHLLTGSQKACLRGVLAHLTSKEIARELGISPHTVDGHLRAALQRLGLQSRTEAALLLAAVEDCFPQPRQGLAAPAHAVESPAAPEHYICSEPFADLQYADSNVTDREHLRNIAYTSDHREQGLLGDRSKDEAGKVRRESARRISGNELNAGHRVLLVGLVSLASAVMFAALVLGISALNNLWS